MFLKKITSVKGVGRFKSTAISGGEYAKYTLMYGGNGRGKTTLCAILRSLQRNDGSIITRRKTFGYTGPQEASLLLDSGPVSFKSGAWTAAFPDVHIFDQDFVIENVHGGQQIGVEQRRAFYRIAVGPKGVDLASAVDALDAEAARLQNEITAEARVIQQNAGRMAIDAYLALAADDDFTGTITKLEIGLKAANNAAEISTRNALQAVALPELPADFEVLLAKGLAEVSADASTKVAAQLAKHGFHEGGEAWLQTGLKYAGDDCPFCGRALEGLDLVAAYQGYFSEGYAAHKLEIDALRAAISARIGEATALRTAQGFKDARADARFWSEYGVAGYSGPGDEDNIVATLKALEKHATALVAAKAAAPLDVVAVTSAYTDALAAWTALAIDLAAANESMAAANDSIQGVKAANLAADPAAAKAALDLVTRAQARHTEPVLSLAAKYAALQKSKADVVAKKSAKKGELDAYDEEMLGGYQSAINAILARFDAGFRVSKCAKNYMGGSPQSAYCLQFGDTEVDVAAKWNGDGPTFGTTLSAGDKNTFALAFFLAQLERDGALAQKIVVFDDPFTSLDDFRREMTAKAVVRVGEKAAQVIVLSHDKYFLDAVRQKIHNAAWAAMQIAVNQKNSALSPWNIEWEVKEGYLQDHMELSDFAAGFAGTAKDMRTKMRPLLEKYIRYRFPNQIADSHWLGDMCGIVRDDPTHPLRPQLADLDDINEYTAPFHHDPNKPFNEDEVMAHVKRTLLIVGGC